MYRVVLYYLGALLVLAFGLSLFGMLPFVSVALIVSTALITVVCWVTNTVFAFIFKVPANVESTFITAFILSLIITPPDPAHYASYLPFLFWAGALAMASKFVLAIGRKHIFNPAAFAVALTSLTINQSASWWVGIPAMFIFVLAGGVLVVRKIRRWDLVFSFFIVAASMIIVTSLTRGSDPVAIAWRMLIGTPLLFFSFIMITEPLTTPPTRILRIVYGALVGFLFAPAMHIGAFYSTPELALLVGNLFSYGVSPKEKLILKLHDRVQATPTVFDFLFRSDTPLIFKPGQYLEWTLGHYRPDARGVRRYFTIASSPTEGNIRLGVKFYEQPSSFKKGLASLGEGDEIVASQLAGDFVMPKDKAKKLVFIAGGIGVTPFRSMVQYLLDLNEKRNITLLYSNRAASEVAYKDVFDRASVELGIKTVYAVTDPDPALPAWCRQGVVTAHMIAEEIPDYAERKFYISGPHAMVTAFRKTLREMGVKRRNIKTDFFPGFV